LNYGITDDAEVKIVARLQGIRGTESRVEMRTIIQSKTRSDEMDRWGHGQMPWRVGYVKVERNTLGAPRM